MGGDGEVPDVGAGAEGEFVLGFEAGQQVAEPAGVVVELPTVRAVACGEVCCPPGAAVGVAGGAVDGRAGQADVEQVVARVGHQRVRQPAPPSRRPEQEHRLEAGLACRIRGRGGDQAGGHDDRVRACLDAVCAARKDVHRCRGTGERVMADGGGRAQHDARPPAHRVIHAASCRRAVVLASAGPPGGSRLGSASGRRVRDGKVMVRGSWWRRSRGG